MTENYAWRSLDANFNRSVEAIRVLEDCFRFSINDAYLSKRLKDLRHRLAAIANQTPTESLLASRDSQRDVGRNHQTEAEYRRLGIDDVLVANFQRSQQSVRSLEEFSKIVDASLAKQLEQIRYELYSIEQVTAASRFGNRTLKSVHLYGLIDECDSQDHFARVVSELIQGGVDAIQLRCKNLDDKELIDRGQLLVELAKSHDVFVFVNDRPDVAAIVQADGVHLGQDDMPVHLARQILHPHQLIGVSTHNMEQVIRAVDDGANYLGLGPVFPSQTKSFDTFPGLDLVSQALSEVSIPAFAIGGIAPGNLQQLIDVGCHRVAVQSAIYCNGQTDIDGMSKIREQLTKTKSVSC